MSIADTEVYQFRPNPGPRERHLKRQHRNPLFKDVGMITQKQVNLARQEDLAELESFTEALQALVKEAMELKPNVESDVVLGLKERADKLYEQAAGLGGKLDSEMEALKKLTAVIMASVRRGAGVDPTALNELDQEDQARQDHYALLRYPLVADLLRPDSPIGREHLVASLLTAETDELRAAIRLFEPEQAGELLDEARALATDVEMGEGAQAALRVMEENVRSA
ncbi:MAG: hypothetical protein ACPG4N_10625 [Gammaproteobacteria bacterium]